MRRFLSRFANLFRRGRAEREAAREIESHLALLREEFERRGLAPADAVRAARLALGGVEQAKELHRDSRAFTAIEQLFLDLRHAWRGLMRNPGFAFVAVAALALGLAANASVFVLYNAIVLKPLAIADPHSVVRFKRIFTHTPGADNPYGFSLAEYRYLREHTAAFSSVVAAVGGSDGNGGLAAFAEIDARGAKEHLEGRAVSANYFEALGVAPQFGRAFRPEEDRLPGGNAVIVLTDRFWQRRFHGDPDVIGRQIQLNGLPYVVIGVAPRKFTGSDLLPLAFDFWAPISMLSQLSPQPHAPTAAEQKSAAAGSGVRNIQILARMRTGVSRNQAQSEADLLIRRFNAGFREPGGPARIIAQPTSYFANPADADLRSIAAIISGIVSLVLLAACANVANMLLARGAARQREIAVRIAVGAGRARVMRHLLAESMLLALFGGAAAMPLSLWAGRLFWNSVAQLFRGYRLNLAEPDLSLDGRLIVYGLAISLLTGALFGLAPALRFTRLDLSSAMKSEGLIPRFGRSRLRGILLGVQAAVSTVLLLVSGSALTGVRDLVSADLGFEPHNAYLVMFDGDTTHQRLREAIASTPQVAATAIGDIPLMSDMLTIPMKAGQWNADTMASHESDGYFETMGIRLARGREFTRLETAHSAAVAVISESTARLCWPRQNALGKQLSLTFGGKTLNFEVVGVARDVRHSSIEELDQLHVYLPTDGTKGTFLGGLMIRIRGDRQSALAAAQAAVASVDRALLPGLQFISVSDGPLAMQRGFAGMAAAIATVLTLLAIALASVGIYGVMAFLVNQRTRELGIRIALGAEPRAIFRDVVFHGLRPVFFGMAAGLVAACGEQLWERSTDLVRDTVLHRLFGDPILYFEVAFMLSVAIVASLIPARRALRIDPIAALRHD